MSTSRRLAFGHAHLAPDHLILGDNLEVLGRTPDRAVDIIYVDPPFGTGTRRRSGAGLGWSDLPPELDDYLAWLQPRLLEMRRVLSTEGLLFIHLDWRAAHYVKVLLDRIFSPRLFVNEIVWCYSVGGKSARAFGRKHDTILCYAGGPRYRFFPDAVRIPRKAGSHMRVEPDEDGRPVQVKRDRKSGKLYRYPVHAGKVPEDYWTDIETLNRSDRERTGWPTQKPEALLRRILLAASAPGDLVADLFCGSGTTAVVAQALGRRFLAVDASEQAIGIAARRLSDAGRALAKRGAAVPDVVISGLGAAGFLATS